MKGVLQKVVKVHTDDVHNFLVKCAKETLKQNNLDPNDFNFLTKFESIDEEVVVDILPKHEGKVDQDAR